MTGKPGVLSSSIPESVRHLALDVVEGKMIRHGARVTDAAAELRVPISDLRKLCFAVPRLMDVALEHEEKRIDLAERRIDEALRSDDSRRHYAAAQFVLRNSARSKRRGWIVTASASVDLTINQSARPIFTWKPCPSQLHDEEARRQEEHRLAEVARAEAEGHQVVTLGWGNPDEPDDDDKVIEHEAGPELLNKD